MTNLVFDAAEYAERLAKTKARMERQGFDLIICADPANMCWLTGYDGWSFYVPQCVLVHLNHEQPIWFGRAQDANAAKVTTELNDNNIVSFSEHLVQNPNGHPFDELAQLIEQHGWQNARIGVEMDAHYYTARCHEALVTGLPNAHFSNNQDLVNWCRLAKSTAELVLMRQAGEICTAATNRAVEVIKPGIRQNEVIAEIYKAQIDGTEEFGGDYAAICPLMPVGEGTSTPHLTWSDDPLPNNVLSMIELAGVRKRYHAPITRTIHIGKPPQKIADVAKIVVEGIDAALEVAKIGNTCEQVEAAWQAVLKKNGLSKKSRVGYPIGLNYPPDWGERTCSLRPGDDTILESGFCFHIQSGIWENGWGVAISESFEVTETGGARLTDVVRDLIVID